jgi:hypothetical protein
MMATSLDRSARHRARAADRLRTHNRLEFCDRAMLSWAYEQGIKLRLIEPGKPN